VDSSVAIMLLVAKLTYYGKWLEKRENNEISFLDYLSYTLFVPSVVAGPTFSFDVYLSFLNNKFEVSLKKIKLGRALEPLGVAIPLIGLAVLVMPTFHTRWVLES
jgi:D-alanyl-lipoteichoic acid acyltransferase DltB (MBOAT superfamily)